MTTTRKPALTRTRIEEIQDMNSPFGDEDGLTPRQADLQQTARGSLLANGLVRAWRNAVEAGASPEEPLPQRHLADAREYLCQALASLDRARASEEVTTDDR
jgi:hypothetical protein